MSAEVLPVTEAELRATYRPRPAWHPGGCGCLDCTDHRVWWRTWGDAVKALPAVNQ